MEILFLRYNFIISKIPSLIIMTPMAARRRLTTFDTAFAPPSPKKLMMIFEL